MIVIFVFANSFSIFATTVPYVPPVIPTVGDLWDNVTDEIYSDMTSSSERIMDTFVKFSDEFGSLFYNLLDNQTKKFDEASAEIMSGLINDGYYYALVKKYGFGTKAFLRNIYSYAYMYGNDFEVKYWYDNYVETIDKVLTVTENETKNMSTNILKEMMTDTPSTDLRGDFYAWWKANIRYKESTGEFRITEHRFNESTLRYYDNYIWVTEMDDIYSYLPFEYWEIFTEFLGDIVDYNGSLLSQFDENIIESAGAPDLYQKWDGYPDSPVLTTQYPYQAIVLSGSNITLLVSSGQIYLYESGRLSVVLGSNCKAYELISSNWTLLSSYTNYQYSWWYGYGSFIQANNDIYNNSSLSVVLFNRTTFSPVPTSTVQVEPKVVVFDDNGDYTLAPVDSSNTVIDVPVTYDDDDNAIPGIVDVSGIPGLNIDESEQSDADSLLAGKDADQDRLDTLADNQVTTNELIRALVEGFADTDTGDKNRLYRIDASLPNFFLLLVLIMLAIAILFIKGFVIVGKIFLIGPTDILFNDYVKDGLEFANNQIVFGNLTLHEFLSWVVGFVMTFIILSTLRRHLNHMKY